MNARASFVTFSARGFSDLINLLWITLIFERHHCHCGDFRQIWTWYSICNQSFDKFEKLESKNGGNWLGNPHPWSFITNLAKIDCIPIMIQHKTKPCVYRIRASHILKFVKWAIFLPIHITIGNGITGKVHFDKIHYRSLCHGQITSHLCNESGQHLKDVLYDMQSSTK